MVVSSGISVMESISMLAPIMEQFEQMQLQTKETFTQSEMKAEVQEPQTRKFKGVQETVRQIIQSALKHANVKPTSRQIKCSKRIEEEKTPQEDFATTAALRSTFFGVTNSIIVLFTQQYKKLFIVECPPFRQ